MVCGRNRSKCETDVYLVPNPEHAQYGHSKLPSCKKPLIQATNYFDFLTNNDTTAQVYFGDISMFNFRNYDGVDVSFADILQKNKG